MSFYNHNARMNKNPYAANTIKETIERLHKDWSYDAMKQSNLRKPLLDSARRIESAHGTMFTCINTDLGRDFRIFSRSRDSFLQWRTSRGGNDRLVSVKFNSSSKDPEHIILSDFFTDLSDINIEEAQIFEMLFREITPLLGFFSSALEEADQFLRDGY